jgi:POT family proton-dependent oligopeptide transporter
LYVATVSTQTDRIRAGSSALFLIQIFSTLGFAVLQSTLVLYATDHLHFPDQEATSLMGVFGAFNFGLHLFGGYLGGRFLSNRNLFVGGMVLQALGCWLISLGTAASMYWGLALFLAGSGLNVTCINMMLTPLFAPDDPRREAAFLWNYSGMNLGFFIGFSGAGHYQDDHRYTALFIFATIGNVLAILLTLFFWKTLADVDTPLRKATRSAFRARFAVGTLILLGVPPIVWALLQRLALTERVTKLGSTVLGAILIYLTLKHGDRHERKNMWAYLILTLGSLVFWSLYQMAPNGLQLFAVRNVHLTVWGIQIAPQWIQNINTVVVVLGGPVLADGFKRLRAHGWRIDIPQQFTAALFLMGLGFLVLPIGIRLADASGRSAFVWLFASYVLQSIGELFISPIGYAMIGKLAPSKYQGIMMGSWMFVTGLASIFAGDLSGVVRTPSGSTALVTNPAYASLFAQLGWGSVAAGVALLLLIPTLRRLIQDPAEQPA